LLPLHPPQKRQKFFTGYKEYLGKDITSLVILPVWIMQPFTMLQNMAEIMEYAELLERAATTEDPHERMAWVVAFTMGPFAAVERPWKPFNPILGETFEYRRPDKGNLRYLAEQASRAAPLRRAFFPRGVHPASRQSVPRHSHGPAPLCAALGLLTARPARPPRRR
jgi:hypothetical protein